MDGKALTICQCFGVNDYLLIFVVLSLPSLRVSLNLSLLKDDSDVSILENESIKIREFSGHKTIYTLNYKGLVDKVMNLWLEINDTVFQFFFQASNTELFELYYDKCIQIINNIKMSK
jgi:hypothetical protein